ncbi:MAG: quinol:electron acceptor oxidoreductase subunit ActD [Acidobacteriota bacterium]|nr:quinol:electron acceptor oxidoreductase subunit ActD [Acidobacteriota bacterium]
MSERTALTLACTDDVHLAEVLDRAQLVDGSRVRDVRSSSPLAPSLAERVPTRIPRVPIFAILGGGLGGLAADLIASLTAQADPMITGHMPIVAAPPVGIITYEGIALGAVLATTLGVLIECRLPSSRRNSEVASRVARGELVVTLDVPANAADELSRLAEPITR